MPQPTLAESIQRLREGHRDPQVAYHLVPGSLNQHHPGLQSSTMTTWTRTTPRAAVRDRGGIGVTRFLRSSLGATASASP